VAADTRNWWGSLSFTTNLVSELIGSLIALPFALLVIDKLAAYQLEEAARPLLEAKVRTARNRALAAVRQMRNDISAIEADVTGATNQFVRGIQASEDGIADIDMANEAAEILRSLMDPTEWTMFERSVTPLRHYGRYLQTVLAERYHNGEAADEIEEVVRLTTEMQSAVSQHRRIMERGQIMFARRPAVSATNRQRQLTLRDTAITYVKSVDRVLASCDEIEAYLTLTPE